MRDRGKEKREKNRRKGKKGRWVREGGREGGRKKRNFVFGSNLGVTD